MTQDAAPVRPPRRKRSKESPTLDHADPEDARIDEIIDEILKSTPDHTLSFHPTTSAAVTRKKTPSVPTARQVEESLNRSQIFREMPPSAESRTRISTHDASDDDTKLRSVLAVLTDGDLQQIQVLQRQVADLKEAEKEQMYRLMSNVSNIANMELKVRFIYITVEPLYKGQPLSKGLNYPFASPPFLPITLLY